MKESVSIKDRFFNISDGVYELKTYYNDEAEVPKPVSEFFKAFEKMDKAMKFSKNL